MWSLPDIHRLNQHAAANAPRLRRAAKSKNKPRCEIHGCHRPAIKSDLWFDIFSHDPKGIIHTCSEHDAEHQDGFFHCDGCDCLMIENYTWERYEVRINHQTLCLKCAAENYFSDEQNWINPGAVREVILDPENPQFFSNGVLNIARCRHVLGVEQPLPSGIQFYENAEFDSQDGDQISGRSLSQIIRELDQPFTVVLDAGYQFACSVGIYVRSGSDTRNGKPHPLTESRPSPVAQHQRLKDKPECRSAEFRSSPR